MAAGAGRLRAAGTDAGVGRGCPGRGGWRRGGRGRRGGIRGPPPAFPGPQFAQPLEERGGGFGAPPRVRRAPGSRKDTANLPARPRLCKGVPPPAGCARVGAGEGRAAGRLFSRLPELPHPTAGSWAGRGPARAPGSGGPRPEGSARLGRGGGGEWAGVGSANFFSFPLSSLPLPPRPWERAGGGRGRGSGGPRGAQPGPAGPPRTAGAGGGLAGASGRLGGSGPQFPLPHSHGHRGLTPGVTAVY